MSIPSMVIPDDASTLCFVAIVLALAALFVAGVARAGRTLGEPPAVTRRWTARAAFGIAGWLALTALVPASGVLAREVMPPPLALFAFASVAVSVAAAFSPIGTRLARGLPIAALVLVQAFRLPLELVLHSWKEQGVLPVQMTFEGHNFDIVSGVLAVLVGGLLLRGSAPRAFVWVFNLIGFGLVLTVSTIAVLSSPLPIRTYLADPPVLLAFHFPYAWIIPICVGGAIFGHLVTFRWLLATGGAREVEGALHGQPAR